MFQPGKLGQSFQYLAVGIGQTNRGLLHVMRIPHDKGVEAIQMPNCVASVWRLAEIGANLCYRESKTRAIRTEGHKRRKVVMKENERRTIFRKQKA